MNRIKKQLKRLKKKRFLPLILIIGLVIASYLLIFRDLPSPTRLNSKDNPSSSRIYDKNNKLLYTIYTNKNRTPITLKEVPQNLQDATLAIEDKDFYHHGAIDFRGIGRAVVANVSGKPIQGGSTLTQQLVKSSLLTPEQTIKRKVKEIILSFATETLYSKPKILEMYLNQIPYGGTAYGAEAASRTYFGKSAKELDLAESALLAGLPQSPTLYSPFGSHPEYAKARQEQVLRSMLDLNYITKEEFDKAVKEELKYKNISNSIKAPHFVLYVKDLLIQKYGEKFVEEGGLKVKTTLDLSIQDFAQDSVASEVAKLKYARVSNGAALVTNPSNGDILAMVGSRDYFDSAIDGNVNVTLALRQPGSSIKPINYAVGLLNGYSPATVFVDKATCYGTYCPRNYDGKFHGAVSMRDSLGSSLNIPAVKMLKLNTVEDMIATASAMGISTFKDPERYGLALTLGGGEVTMMDMATAFGVFANRGYKVNINPIVEVRDQNNKVIEKRKDSSILFGKRILPEGVTYLISHILADNAARLIAFGAASELVIPKQTVSVKTGTTNDYKDNWTIGYTKDFLVASWVGNNDNTPMSGVVSGVTGAAPIWHKIMAHLLEKQTTSLPPRPKDVIGINICKSSGLLPQQGDNKCETRFEYFIRSMIPKKTDPGKTNVWVDKDSHDLPKPGQTDNLELKEEYVVEDSLGDRYCVSCPHPTATPTPTPNP